MIVCENLHKQYGRQVVLSDFSCRFADAGFYLLYGESGSGKTTLINILSGMIPFEGGKISVNGQAFTTCVDWQDSALSFDYITQDSFFADFLTVSENLELISDDKEKIAAVLSQFGLPSPLPPFPAANASGCPLPGPAFPKRKFCSLTSQLPPWTKQTKPPSLNC